MATRTLLDVIHTTSDGSTTLNARLAYVARARDKNLRTAMETLHRDVMDQVSPTTSAPLTGMLLVWDSCCLHYLEGPHQDLQRYIGAITASLAGKDAPIVDPRVCTFVDDTGPPTYSFWDCSQLTATAGDEIDAVVYAEAADFMAEAGSSMIALGSQLSAFDTQKRATAIQKLQTFATDLPSPDRVTSMAMSHDLLSLDEFTSLFTKPVDISPPWDGVWPAPSSIVL